MKTIFSTDLALFDKNTYFCGTNRNVLDVLAGDFLEGASGVGFFKAQLLLKRLRFF
jgi:hypothetical protein